MKHFKADKEATSDQRRNAQPPVNERVHKDETLQSWLVNRLAERLSVEPGEIDIHESFSNYGLDSATAVELSGELETLLGRELAPTLFFDYPNIGVLLRHLLQDKKSVTPDARQPEQISGEEAREPIAIIGIACRFPGNANTPEQFWHLLQNGVDAVTEVPSARWNSSAFYDPDPETPGKMYTRSGAFLQDLDQFDAHFFGISAREAVRMHPQQRLLLEVAWEALENAGQRLESLAESQTAVFIGAMATHDYALLQAQAGDKTYIDDPYFGIGNASSITSGRLSYLFNLQGPNLAIDTACSSSLVAVHLACKSLQNHESSMAIVGGVSTNLHPEQMINACKMHMLSPDGLCKTFDADADGFVMGEGCGVVVLKRLSDALNAKDSILAIIRGSAVNQDGHSNGITAPNKFAQEAVIRQALTQAQVDPLAVSYVEAHGSATSLGDPIEVEALAATFGQDRSLAHPLMIGSVKTNIGHLAGAAGIAGLIKTVLALQHKEIPPHLHLKKRNPHVHWDACPVVIPTVRLPWLADDGRPRLAGVSSFGWSGTNAHVILEEGPHIALDAPETSKAQLVLLSAKTEEALELATATLLDYLKQHPRVSLADVAYTYHVGRTTFAHRRSLVCENVQEAIHALEQRDSTKIATGFSKESPRSLAFLFPNGEGLYAGMARQLYQLEPTFRAYVNTCTEIARSISGLNLLAHLYPDYWLARTHDQYVLDQLAVFAIEYALAQLLLSWGITPTALLGNGVGEYVSACLSGIFSLRDALQMVVLRARASQGSAHEEMLVGPLVHEDAVSALSTHHPTGAQTGSEEFLALMRGIELSPAQIPCISNASGRWITPEQATDPMYWSRRLSQTVASAQHGREIQLEQPDISLQIGPGQMGEHFDRSSVGRGGRIVPTLPLAYDPQPDRAFLLHSMGQLWRAGVSIEGAKWYAYEKRHLLPLPNYPFIRQRYWIEMPTVERPAQKPSVTEMTKQDRSQWLYVPIWKQAQPPLTSATRQDAQCILLFLDDYGFGWRLGGQLRAQGHTVFTVTAGQSFQYMPEERYTLRPDVGEDYDALLRHLSAQGHLPDQIVHLWSVTRGELDTQNQPQLARLYDNAFYSLLYLAQAIGNHLYASALHLTIISNQLHNVLGDEQICPEKALLLGPCKVLPKEYPALSCCSIDITLADPGSPQESALLKKLAMDIFRSTDKDVIAYRGTQRWEQAFENVRLPEHTHGKQTPLRKGGVYLITGGLGGIGLAIAEHLARTVQARLVLLGRTPLPPREQWPTTVAARSTTAILSRQLYSLQYIEELGGQVLPLQADVTDEDQMQAVIKQTLATFGTLHGVIHAAGIPGMGLLQLKTPEQAALVLAPKVRGTRVLARVLAHLPLDFLALFSSISSSVGGGPGQADYCAANAFLDAFANQHFHQYGKTIAIDWAEWQWNAWEAGLAGYDSEMQSFLKEHRQRMGITFAEGTQAFVQTLTYDLPQLVVSTQDLAQLASLVKSFTATSLQQSASNREQSAHKHPRPMLGSSYTPPRNQLEQAIASIWEELLSITPVGIYDNFFELGGNSLLGINLTSRIRKTLQLETFPAHVLYEAPSVSTMAQYIDQGRKSNVITGRQERGEKRRAELTRRMQDVRQKR